MQKAPSSQLGAFALVRIRFQPFCGPFRITVASDPLKTCSSLCGFPGSRESLCLVGWSPERFRRSLVSWHGKAPTVSVARAWMDGSGLATDLGFDALDDLVDVIWPEYVRSLARRKCGMQVSFSVSCVLPNEIDDVCRHQPCGRFAVVLSDCSGCISWVDSAEGCAPGGCGLGADSACVVGGCDGQEF